MDPPRIGLAISGGLTAPEIVECVRLAENLGYESAWVAEGHGGDQFAILAACATATTRIRLGTSISSVFVRSVPTIAMAAATVDALSNGRFVLGLGSSHRVQVEGEHGLPYAKPISRVRESVEAIRALLRDGEVSYRGETIAIDRFDLWFTPLRRTIPIYLSGLFPPMLEACGELADGLILTWSTVDAPARAAAHVATGARRAGRRPEDVEIASLLPCVIAEDRREALERMRPAVAMYAGFFPRYNRLLAEAGFPDAARAIQTAWQKGDREGAARAVSDAMAAAVGLVGTPAECRARIEDYRAAGLGLPIISPRARGKGAREAVMMALRSCAPTG
ncbi:MAG TPA: LLM class flavin-dependent oxidoreductase [Methylomirabilota bacterium]|nr:LLM class flavin-dependent oxidoreductase [Methylomirabilota bacterium]